MAFHGLPEEFQGCLAITALCDKAFQDLSADVRQNDGPNGFVFVAPDDVESPFPDLKAIEATSIPCQTEGVIDDGET
jgi:hypothetical protein